MREDRSLFLSWWVVSSPTPVGVMLKLSLFFYIACMEKLPFSLFSSEKQISQVFPFCCSCCFFLVNVHFVYSSLAWFSLVCCP